MQPQWQIESLALQHRHALTVQATESVTIPFSVLVGNTHRPAALIMAGVHGDEYEGPAAILDLVDTLDPALLHGSIIFVPFANPEAFAAATRRHPADHGDLNRSFPGQPDGDPTARLAYRLVTEFVLQSDCIFSLHGWGREAVVLPYVEYPAGESQTCAASKQAALATGFGCVYAYDWPRGVLGNFVIEQGIPIIEGEVGGMATITSSGQSRYWDAITRFLAHFGIVRADFTAPPKPLAVVDHTEARATHQGLFQSSVELGERVRVGESLGVIRSMDGQKLQMVIAPCGGIVGVMRTLASVNPGDMLFHLFREGENS